jgi:hypothetical protein
MRKTAIIILVLAILTSLKADHSPTVFTEGQQLFVVANAGLNLRETPDRASLTLTTIPYGELIQIINSEDECIISQEIEWVGGSWAKVSYDGYIGYVFDGFLSPLAVPTSTAELMGGSANMFQLIDNWVDIHMLSINAPDTLANEINTSITQLFEGGEKYEKQLFDNGFRMNLYFSDVRIMDVFHLIKGFYKEADMKEEIDLNSLFIKDKNGSIRLIKIYHDQYCEIKKLSTGQIRLSISETFDGC